MLLVLCLWGVLGGAALAVTDPSAGGLVNCGKGDAGPLDCNFAKAVAMANVIINWLIMIATSLAAIAFAYAGWLYLSAGDNSGQVTKARAIFLDVAIGFIILLSAWLVFKFIETTFLNTNNGYATYLN